MKKNCVILSLSTVIVFLFCVKFFADALESDVRKHCCQVGTNYSLNGFDCQTFLPEMMGSPDLTGNKICLNLVDVCCKKQYKEILCAEGVKDAKSKGCSSIEADKKECCEACQAGIDAGNNKEACGGLGLGEPYDSVFTNCCNEAKTTIKSIKTMETTQQTKITTSVTPRSSIAAVENICDSDVCAQICLPVGTSFRCDCSKGYILMEDGISCKPQKRKKGGRCEINNPCDHDCVDTGTAIKCSCRDGYKLAANGRTCSDIDECELNLHDCPSKEDCVNEIGSFYCYEPYIPDESENDEFGGKCPTGYKFNFENLACDDIDECLFDLMCIPPKICKNTVGSFLCEGEDVPTCPPGFHYKPATQACADIDECLTGENDCNKESQECLNTKGNYTCVDKASRFTCPPGFKKNFQTQLCEDINECEEDPNLCEFGETCVNESGGHSCVPDANQKPSVVNTQTERTSTTTRTTKTRTTPTTTRSTTRTTKTQTTPTTTRSTTTTPRRTTPTTTTTSTTTTTRRTTRSTPTTTTTRMTTRRTPSTTTARPTCPSGYNFMPETNACADVNECQIGSHDCEPLERCDNTIGSYHCSRIFGCGTGYTLNLENGLCEDDDECTLGTHNCWQLGHNFECRNTLGSYRCLPIRHKQPVTKPTTTTTTTTISTTTTKPVLFYSPPPDESINNKPKVVPEIPVYNYPYNGYQTPPSPPYQSNTFTYLTTEYLNTTTARTSPIQHPTIYFKPYPNTPNILPYSPKTTSRSPPIRVYPTNPSLQYPIITGQLKKCLPGYTMNSRGECEDIDECLTNPCGRHEKCINYNGRYNCASPMQCKIGFELDESGEKCIDVNECTRGTHKCNPTQICKNYQGYYTCECPTGHHFNKKTDMCEDMDECKIFRPCGYADCINTIGSYKCECKRGFRRINNKCEDIDECNEQSGLCEQKCINIWGSYRCSCKAGFTLNSDNRTCTDIDECERFKNKLCIGTCKNIPGSYACECPSGYKLGSDGRICLDIDECLQNICPADDVCVNTRGGYKCYGIKCPENYIKDTEHKSRCKRLQSLCDPRDYKCLLQPEQYTYQYINLVSNLPLSRGHIQLFQIKGPQWVSAKAEFTMKLLEVNCPYWVKKVDDGYFQKVTDQANNVMALYLIKPIQGPQEMKLQIEMRLFSNNIFIGNAIVYIIIVVSEHPF